MSALTTLLGVDHPIVLGPFGGLSSIELTAAVSNGGGLGSYGLYGYDADRIRSTIADLRGATDRPFAVNLWLPTGTERDATPAEFAASLAVLAPFFDELGLTLPEAPGRYLPAIDEQWAAVLEQRPAVVSVVFGVPSPGMVAEAREAGIVLIGTATTVDEAVALADGGVDAVVASGFEAAGHRTSFLGTAEESLVGSVALIPQVADAVPIPVIAAGGIADARGVAAAFALGAAGAQVGTAFLRTRQSAANDAHRAAIGASRAHDTVLTRAMSGRLSRGARNRAVRAIEQAQIEQEGAIAPFPAQNWLTGRFRPTAGERGVGDLQSLWLGQGAGLARFEDARELLAELIAGVP
jgi:nitronate monooxygenase